jgi:hypothetical protein
LKIKDSLAGPGIVRIKISAPAVWTVFRYVAHEQTTRTAHVDDPRNLRAEAFDLAVRRFGVTGGVALKEIVIVLFRIWAGAPPSAKAGAENQASRKMLMARHLELKRTSPCKWRIDRIERSKKRRRLMRESLPTWRYMIGQLTRWRIHLVSENVSVLYAAALSASLNGIHFYRLSVDKTSSARRLNSGTFPN